MDIPAAFLLQELEGCGVALGDGGSPGFAGLFRDAAVGSDLQRVRTIIGRERVADLNLPVVISEEMILR